MTRVLHVTEAMGGGITSALAAYARSTPDVDHHLVFCERGDFRTGQSLEENFASISNVGRGPRALYRAIPEALKRVRPDILHLHSAWAGAVGRLRSPRVPIIYTPHSFFFERANLSVIPRATARQIERLLAGRTSIAACVSPYETELAQGLGMRAQYVPNEAGQLPPDLVRAWGGERARREVVTVGRLSAQKDPAFFLQVVRDVRARGVDVQWVWAGDGDDECKTQLQSLGVEVTGWAARDVTLNRVATSSLYLHTAAWEGSPMTLLEAEEIGVPIVARSIPALVSMGYPDGLDTPERVADAVVSVVRHGASPVGPQRPPKGTQALALRAVYRGAVGDSS